MRQKDRVTTHRARRIKLCDKFAEKAAQNPSFQSWFPSRKGRSGLTACSTPHYFRRFLNGKPGESYRERNIKYRE